MPITIDKENVTIATGQRKTSVSDGNCEELAFLNLSPKGKFESSVLRNTGESSSIL